MFRYLNTILLLFLFCLSANAQMEGTVKKRTGDSLFADVNLKGVEVKAKKKRYSRKNNPAVELMKRVIAAKKQNKLTNKPYYQYQNYEKMTISLNGVTGEMLDSGLIGRTPWLRNQVEYSPLSGQLILPFMLDEKVTKVMYRKDPEKQRTLVIGERSEGINQIFETGNIFNALSADAFCEVDIYDNSIRLLRRTMTSPIADDAIGFYRYYILDTVKVERDSCYHVFFTPNNPQDFGFNGDMYILKDSSLHVRKVSLSIPKSSGINFVEGMQINQEFELLSTGDWVLTVNDLIVALRVNQSMAHGLMVKTSTRSNYSFEPIDDKLLSGVGELRKDANAEIQDEQFWRENRKVDLTTSERNMGKFVKDAQSMKGFNWIMFFIRPVVENFVETGFNGKPSKFDIGPVNTIISHNFIDGCRVRLSGLTTANLNRHLFLSGYVAHGFNTKRNYYKGELTYSFNPKKYIPMEFPRRTIMFHSSYDVMSPSDKFLVNDKDNVFTAFKWAKVDKMMFYHRHKLEFEYEEEWGLRLLANIKVERNEGAGNLHFRTLAEPDKEISLRTTEMRFEVEYAPGRTFINTKQNRIPNNNDAPVFKLSHTLGVKGFLGGDYNYNVTEASIYKRFWLNSWGKLNCNLKGGVQWSQAPYPLLMMPAANLSYIVQKGCFNLVNNMEFLNDRYASADIEWDLAGKIFNRVPLLKKLKWREVVGFKTLWGGISDKNNPFLEKNQNSALLMEFPEGCTVMDPNRPYAEFSVGIYNIFKFFRVQYVRRLNYLDLPTANRDGVRLMFEMTF